MATAGYRTVEVGHYDAGPMKEAVASGSITPGMLLERTSASTPTVKAHATAGARHNKLFACEDDLQGKEISEAYATTTRVRFRAFRTGDEVYAILKDGQNAAIGNFLVSNGDGKLKVMEGDSSAVEPDQHVVGVALEAVDLSASANTADSRILVEIA